MADFVRLTNYRDETIFVNVERVTAVTKGGKIGFEGPHSTIHFDEEHGFLVKGAPVDVMDVLWPAFKQKA